MALVHERTIPTERPLLVREVSANGVAWSAKRIPTAILSTEAEGTLSAQLNTSFPFLLRLLFDPEDGDNTFFSNNRFSPNEIVLQSRRSYYAQS
jgi:hypothetical protein